MIFRRPIRVVQEKYDEVRKLAIELETANRQLTESKLQLENYTAELTGFRAQIPAPGR